MTETAIIDLITTRLPDDADTYPHWTVRCRWAGEGDSESDSVTFHAAPDARSAVGLSRFVLDRYRNLDTHNLKSAEIRRPDGSWQEVSPPTSQVVAPGWFTFGRLPRRPE
ncbi:MAG TPA: hypothetical protein VL551_29015 [Actinospica sp.]|jgi:hypothetical protein|nr:hypothetical protein [Actinospica sp.]